MVRIAEFELSPASRIGARPTLTLRRGALPCAAEAVIDCPVLHPYGDWSGRVGSRILTAGRVVLAGAEYGVIAMSVVLGADGGEVGGRPGALWHSVALTATPAAFVAAWRQGVFGEAAGLLEWFPVLGRLGEAPAPIAAPGAEGHGFAEEVVRLVRAVSGSRVALRMPADPVEGERWALDYVAREVVRTARSPGIEASDPCELIMVPGELWSGLPVRAGRTLVA